MSDYVSYTDDQLLEMYAKESSNLSYFNGGFIISWNL